MIREIDDPSAIDSTCYAPPLDADGPTDEQCNSDATTYVSLPSGARRYICPAHADEVDRFDDVLRENHPRVAVCDACQRLTPADKVSPVDGRCPECAVD